MCKQMILTVFIIAVAFRAESELEVFSVKLGPSAHSTFVTRDNGMVIVCTCTVSGIHSLSVGLFELHPAFYVPGP